MDNWTSPVHYEDQPILSLDYNSPFLRFACSFTDPNKISAFAADMVRGNCFPAVLCSMYPDGYIEVVDGHHRAHAAVSIHRPIGYVIFSRPKFPYKRVGRTPAETAYLHNTNSIRS